MATQGETELAPPPDHMECTPIFRAILPGRQLRADRTAASKQAKERLRLHRGGWGNVRALWELRECSRTGGTTLNK